MLTGFDFLVAEVDDNIFLEHKAVAFVVQAGPHIIRGGNTTNVEDKARELHRKNDCFSGCIVVVL